MAFALWGMAKIFPSVVGFHVPHVFPMHKRCASCVCPLTKSVCPVLAAMRYIYTSGTVCTYVHRSVRTQDLSWRQRANEPPSVRLSIGIHSGRGRIVRDRRTNRYDYTGAVVEVAAQVTDVAQGYVPPVVRYRGLGEGGFEGEGLRQGSISQGKFRGRSFPTNVFVQFGTHFAPWALKAQAKTKTRVPGVEMTASGRRTRHPHPTPRGPLRAQSRPHQPPSLRLPPTRRPTAPHPPPPAPGLEKHVFRVVTSGPIPVPPPPPPPEPWFI